MQCHARKTHFRKPMNEYKSLHTGKVDSMYSGSFQAVGSHITSGFIESAYQSKINWLFDTDFRFTIQTFNLNIACEHCDAMFAFKIQLNIGMFPISEYSHIFFIKANL